MCIIYLCVLDLPDLVPSKKHLVDSIKKYPMISKRTVQSLSCEIEEGCISNETISHNPLSVRQLLKFTVFSYNFGLVDAKPFANEQEWDYHTCHSHYHSVEEFAIFDLLNLSGERVTESLKASFCLMDSSCIESFGQTRKYSCSPQTPKSVRQTNQGITKGCGDAYGRSTPCQWLDVTDVPDGVYTLLITVNPSNGILELDYENNQLSCAISLKSKDNSDRRTKLINCLRRGE